MTAPAHAPLAGPVLPAPAISVVLCTHRPDSSTFSRVLDSLTIQMPPKGAWELVLVLNGPAAHTPPPAFSAAPITTLRLTEPGLTAARLLAFRERPTQGFILVDDDTILAPDYLLVAEQALAQRPELGAIGGRITPEFSMPCPAWARPSLGNLAIRDFGDQEIVSARRGFGPWLPIGAGMVVRRAVVDRFVGLFSNGLAPGQFGRRAGSLAGGEDSLLGFGAFDLGFSCAYLPGLQLTHVIPPHRLTRRYLARLNFSLGQSHAHVCQALGLTLPRPGPVRLARDLWKHHRVLRRHFSRGHGLLLLWQIGFALASGCVWGGDDVHW